MSGRNKIDVIQKFLQDKTSDEELKSLFVWLNSEKGQAEIESYLGEKWTEQKIHSDVSYNPYEVWGKIKKRHKKISHPRTYSQLFAGLRNAAAVFLLGIILTVSYFTVFNRYDSGETIIKESVSAKKIQKINLPDGTNVWLMSGSTISYPSTFKKSKTRNVAVTGEAFFNVAEDNRQPFVLTLGTVGLKVTGTSFNVSNYNDEKDIQVVLASGTVELFLGQYGSGNKQVRLSPGQMATYSKGGSIFRLKNVRVENYTSWKEGKLVFQNDPLDEVFKKLQRWYNISIVVNDHTAADYGFTATIKNENLEQIIDLLKFATPFSYSLVTTEGVPALYVNTK